MIIIDKIVFLRILCYYLKKEVLSMKTNIELQFEGNDILSSDIEKCVKEDIKSRGIKLQTIDSLDIYYKPRENDIYYVAVDKDGKVFGTNNTPLHL
ncbi:MAG: DUF6465 family protein [Eggerthia catenaformis]